MNAFDKFIKAIADWRMDPPELYGWYHITWLLITAIACVLVVVYRHKISERGVNITLIVWGALLIVSEVLKQLMCSFRFNGETVVWKYDWNVFPFQFCSAPLYFALPAGLFKKGKVKNFLMSFLADFAMVGGIAAMVYPANMFSGSGYLTVHTMLWHSSMIVICLMLWTTESVKADYSTLLNGFALFFAMTLTALAMNIIVGELTEITDFNMFFISPYQAVPVPIVEYIYAHAPYFVYFLLYLAVITFAAYLIILIAKTAKNRSEDELLFNIKNN